LSFYEQYSTLEEPIKFSLLAFTIILAKYEEEF